MIELFTHDERSKPSFLRKDMLPTKNDCLFYVLSRTTPKATHHMVVWEMARELTTIWNKADCCPHVIQSIERLFDTEIWKKYNYLMREKTLPGHDGPEKRSHKKKATTTQPR